MILGVPIGLAACVYILGVMIFTPYYNWTYAKTHGFIEWLAFGELNAELQAFAWPFFLFKQSDPSATVPPEIAAIKYHNQRVEISKKYGGVGPAGVTAEGTASSPDWEAIVAYDKLALSERKKQI